MPVAEGMRRQRLPRKLLRFSRPGFLAPYDMASQILCEEMQTVRPVATLPLVLNEPDTGMTPRG